MPECGFYTSVSNDDIKKKKIHMFHSGSYPGTSPGEKAIETGDHGGEMMQRPVPRIPITFLSSLHIQFPRD